jgi:predicted RNA-binding Zn ribbon-like protein
MAQWRLRSEHYLSHETITLLEGRLCLGLVNTLHPRSGRHVHDALTGYLDLLAWNRSIGMLTEGQEQHLLREARMHPQEALRAFERAIALRETIYRVFSAVAAGNAPQSEDLVLMQATFAEAMAHASLAPTAHEFSWEWGAGEEPGHGYEEQPQLLLWPVALSALELLTSAKEWGKLKECPGCGWLFLDSSKVGNRRWCSMDACGSRAKMRRQYARKRALR